MKISYATGLKCFIGLQVVIFIIVSGSLVHPSHLLLSPVNDNWALNRELFASRPWTLVTHAFMHGGILHLTMNMIALFFLGMVVTVEAVRREAIVAYTVGLFTSAALVLAIPPAGNLPTVGASGAIFALLGLMVTFVEFNDLKASMLKLIALNALFSLIPGISWQGHLGGLLGGIAVGMGANYLIARDDDKVLAENKFEGLTIPEKGWKDRIGVIMGTKKAWAFHDKRAATAVNFVNHQKAHGLALNLIRITDEGNTIPLSKG